MNVKDALDVLPEIIAEAEKVRDGLKAFGTAVLKPLMRDSMLAIAAARIEVLRYYEGQGLSHDDAMSLLLSDTQNLREALKSCKKG